MKKFALLLVLIFAQFVGAAAYSGGAGTSASPYLISTPADLVALATPANSADWASYFKQTANINMVGIAFGAGDYAAATGIGNGTTAWTGNYDGQGFVISNGTWCDAANDQTKNWNALFWVTASPSVIKNLTLSACTMAGVQNVATASGYCALLVGEHGFGSKVINCTIGGTVTYTQSVAGQQSYVGIIVGANHGSIYNSSASGTITFETTAGYNIFVGGLVGYQTGYGAGSTGNISGCYNCTDTTTIQNATDATFALDSASYTVCVGGIFGSVIASNTNTNFNEVVNCRYNGTMALTWTGANTNVYVGGICGYPQSRVVNCSAQGTIGVSGVNSLYKIYVGGAFGDMSSATAMVNNCWANCATTVNYRDATYKTYVGGFVGNIAVSINDCYALGTLFDPTQNPTSKINYTGGGGFAGHISGAGTVITNCWSAVTFSSAYTTAVKGFIGGTIAGTQTACFWDKTIGPTATDSTGCTGKTTAQMQTQSTFTGYDFLTPIWTIAASNYPVLKWVADNSTTDTNILYDRNYGVYYPPAVANVKSGIKFGVNNGSTGTYWKATSIYNNSGYKSIFGE